MVNFHPVTEHKGGRTLAALPTDALSVLPSWNREESLVRDAAAPRWRFPPNSAVFPPQTQTPLTLVGSPARIHLLQRKADTMDPG